jgi:hypothetical protein
MAEATIRASREELLRSLFPEGARPSMKTWAVLDCARDERVYGAMLQSSNDRSCLFAGALHPELAVSAPYVIALDPDDRLTAALVNRGWGNAWGIFLRSNATLAELRRHLRTFLRVRSPDGSFLLFRYYDPRVLRLYLPTCVPNELEAVFGNVIDSFHVEAADGSRLQEYRVAGGVLKQG